MILVALTSIQIKLLIFKLWKYRQNIQLRTSKTAQQVRVLVTKDEDLNFYPQDPYGRRTEPNAQSCFFISTCTLLQTLHIHTGTYIHYK